MKQMLSFLLAGFLSFTLLANPNSSEADYIFTIHIGAFAKADLSDFEEIKPLGFMYAQRHNNLLKVYMGDYKTEGQAMKVLTKIKANNYLNAFITRRDLSKGNNTRVIQLATKPAGKNINWEEYAAAGE
ncbi:MAG: SPOR domain-containing protein, partial [Saprospiraceae bacterium]